MEYGIIHYGTAAYHNLSAAFPTCSIAVEHPNGYTKRKWSTVLHDLGLTASSESPPEDLFQFVKSAFEKQKGVRLDVEFARGYVASPDGTLPVPSQEASRLYASRKHIYVDELVFTSLFEYIATYYIWAKDFEDRNAFSFCFRYTVSLLNYSCRLGILTDEVRKAELVTEIGARCDNSAVNLIADLYWSCLAFAFCHEFAHIYLEHAAHPPENPNGFWDQEYEADAVGYDVYLQIIESVGNHPNEPFEKVFHDYLYIAPMVLFQFYEDTYYLGYWLFGERTGDSHPPLRDRLNALLRLSESDKYTFETREGNIVLNNYMDISDCFREQLLLKLRKGKLNSLLQEGVAFMEAPGYTDALEFQKSMCERLKGDAQLLGVDKDLLVGLWDTAVDIEILNAPGNNEFIWSHNGKAHSTKAFNIQFALKKILVFILEFGASFQMPDDPVRTVLTALLILYNLVDCSTIDLDKTHANVLIKCHEMDGYNSPIEETDLLEATGCTYACIDELVWLGCLEVQNGSIRLRERIFI